MRRVALALVLVGAAVAPPSAQAEFGFPAGAAGFEVSPLKAGGSPENRAGVHPGSLRIKVERNQDGEFSDGDLRALSFEMPAGFLVNPATIEPCSPLAFRTPRDSPYEPSESGESCPVGSQVGVVTVRSNGETRHFGVFNLDPPYGSPIALGFNPYGAPIIFASEVRDNDAGLTFELKNLSQARDFQSFDLTLWGTPWATVNDSSRGNCLRELDGGSHGSCPVPAAQANPERIKAMLTMPTSCDAPLDWSIGATSWQGDEASAAFQSGAMVSCKNAANKASLRLTTSRASSGASLVFELAVDDGGGILNPGGIARPSISSAEVDFPEGLSLNPSLGNGVEVCSEAQFAKEGPDTPFGAGCPGASKIGSIEIEGMLGLSKDQSGFGFEGLAEPLRGSVFVAEPFANRYGARFAIFMAAALPERGLFVRSAGKLDLDPKTGRMTATFEDLPRLLYERFTLRFREGQRPPLVSPNDCGTYPMAMRLRAWGRPTVTLKESAFFAIDLACPQGARPFRPVAVAGALNPRSHAFSPFYVHLTRDDLEQEITSYALELPRGVTARLAGIPRCGEAAIAAARVRDGRDEISSPSCPSQSRIGRTLSGYGVGNVLAYAPGRIYLAGPYNGSPLSLVTINAATVGPFDLGTIVIRSAFKVDELSGQLRIDPASSDAIPHILAGVPLRLRDIRIYIDRFEFTHNPSSCAASQVVSTLTGAGERFDDPSDDSLVALTNNFRMLDCAAMGFKPKLGLRLRGGSRRGAYPQLRANFVSRGTIDSNLKRIEVEMPHSIFLAQEHIRSVCTRAQFAAEACPAGSVYGKAVVHTRLFDQPLRGDVYLRSSTRRLPDLVASLRSDDVRVVIEGRIGRGDGGGIRAFFDHLPDAPIERFTMTLSGGRRGLLVNASNICRRPPEARIKALGQNNSGVIFSSTLRGQCKKGAGKKRKGKRRGHSRKRSLR